MGHIIAAFASCHKSRAPFGKKQKGEGSWESKQRPKNALIYRQLVKLEKEDVFYSATAKTADEARNLVESGFGYVCTTLDCLMLFRKRK